MVFSINSKMDAIGETCPKIYLPIHDMENVYRLVVLLPYAPVVLAVRGSVTEAVTRGKVMKKVPNLIAELELYPV
jgi:hypothetical protein